jgi:hypothetical protein
MLSVFIFVEGSTGEKNQLLCQLGEPLFELLLDWLSYPEGPRLRDRISHAEVEPLVMQQPLLARCLFVALLGLLGKSNVKAQLDPSLCAEEREFFCWLDDYKPCFHPFAMLRSEIISTGVDLQFCYQKVK